jgi:hypothetical protein
VILPIEFTVTILELLEDQTGELLEDTDAITVVLAPIFNLNSVELKVISGFSTMTSQVFDTPSTVAVMVAVPFFCAVMVPF